MITTRKLERQRRKYKITPLRKGMSSRSPWMTGASTSVRSSRSSGSTSCSTSSCSIWSPRPSGRPAWSTGRWHPAPSWQVRPWTPCSRPGGWKVVGNRPSDAARFLPAYKRDTPRGIFVKDFLTTRQRPATPEEAERLPARALHLAHDLPDGTQLLPRPGRPSRLLRHHGPRQYHHRPRDLRRLRY